jgi:23S rRNA (guanosine2251-2'-O)-methyltransferase
MKVTRVGNLLTVIDALRKRGLLVLGAAAGQGTPLEETDFRPACAIVVGSEGRGMREAVARRCDSLFQIPQKGKISSLNVSVAGAIALYEAARQRKGTRAAP